MNTEPAEEVKKQYTFNPVNRKSDGSSDVLYETFAGKKTRMIFYSTRKILLFQNGALAYYNKSSKELKKRINPDQITRVERKNRVLTIFT